MYIQLSTSHLQAIKTVNITIKIPIPKTLKLMSVNGWIVVQQRLDANLSFNLLWANYLNAFGVYNANFWYDLRALHQLTRGASYRLRIEIQAASNGTLFSADYSSFYVDSADRKCAIYLEGYTGDAFSQVVPAGVLMNRMNFSTPDNNGGSGNCAVLGGGSWWYNACGYGNRNGDYATEFYWQPLIDVGASSTSNLKTSRMMIAAN